MDFQFIEATRDQLWLRMALSGVSGGGKTFTALALMSFLLGDGPSPDMTKRIAVIDSERGSSRRYAKGRPFWFSVLELQSFSPETYVEAIKAAHRAGFEGLVIDSLSHEWAGTDGALEQVDKVARRSTSKSSFSAWGDVTPRHNAVIDTIMSSPLHVIGTMRAKQAYDASEKDERGKTIIKKLGLEPVQRSGVEFEFDIIGEMDVDNTMRVTKSRCVELAGKDFRRPGRELAEKIRGWLLDGDAPAQVKAPAAPASKPAERMPTPAIAEAAREVAGASLPLAATFEMRLRSCISQREVANVSKDIGAAGLNDAELSALRQIKTEALARIEAATVQAPAAE